MATDLVQLVLNLRECYSFTNKSVCLVGAGEGQLIELYRQAREIAAVDSDPTALEALMKKMVEDTLKERMHFFLEDFLVHRRKVDVVVFEFSLHEMEDPAAAIAHARTLAPEIIIFDHAPGSEWAWHTCEEVKIERSFAALATAGIRRRADFHTVQAFDNRARLEERIKGQGQVAIDRAQKYPAGEPITIAMDYLFILL